MQKIGIAWQCLLDKVTNGLINVYELMSLIEQTASGAKVYKSHTESHAPRIRSNESAAYFKSKSSLPRENLREKSIRCLPQK